MDDHRHGGARRRREEPPPDDGRVSMRPSTSPPIVGSHFFTADAGTFPRPGSSTCPAPPALRPLRAFRAAVRGTDRRADAPFPPPSIEARDFSVEAPLASRFRSEASIAPFLSSGPSFMGLRRN